MSTKSGSEEAIKTIFNEKEEAEKLQTFFVVNDDNEKCIRGLLRSLWTQFEFQ
jgi:hypothetical protein